MKCFYDSTEIKCIMQEAFNVVSTYNPTILDEYEVNFKSFERGYTYLMVYTFDEDEEGDSLGYLYKFDEDNLEFVYDDKILI